MTLEARFRRLFDVVEPGAGLLKRLPAGTDAVTDLFRRLPGELCLTEPCCWPKFDGDIPRLPLEPDEVVCLCCW